MRIQTKYIKLKNKKLFILLSLLFAIIIIHLSITGLILMLSGPLKLDQTYVNKNIILKSYGMKTTKDVMYEEYGKDIIFYIMDDYDKSGNVFLNDEKITTISSPPAGSLFTQNKKKLIIAEENSIRVINLNIKQSDKNRFEYFTVYAQKKFSMIGRDTEEKIYLYSGTQILIFDQNTNKIIKPPLPISPSEILKEAKNSNLEQGKIFWSCIINLRDCDQKPDQDILKKGLYLYQGPGVSVAKVVADMHNGKLFGYTVTILFFAAGLILNISIIINNIQKIKIVFQTLKKYLIYALKD